MSVRKIGGHVSAAGGVDKAVERAKAIGANCVQVFSGSPRVWQRPNLDAIDAEKVFAKQKELDVTPIFTHALYLLNLASDNPELLAKSKKAILFDLQFDSKLHGAGVIVHLGSHQGRGWEKDRQQVAEAIKEILKQAPKDAHFLMENAVSQMGKIGGSFEEIRWLLDEVKSPQLGWCMDTCHAFAGGYSLGSTGEKSAIKEIERLSLAEPLHCLHVNDSRDPFASGRDRHANLGDGTIPSADLKFFLNHPLIKEKPLLLEVPGVEGEGPDAENIRRLKALLT